MTYVTSAVGLYFTDFTLVELDAGSPGILGAAFGVVLFTLSYALVPVGMGYAWSSDRELGFMGWLGLAALWRCCTARSKSLTSLMPVAESPGAVRIGHPKRGHLVEYLAPNSVFNSLPRQRSCSHLLPDDRFVTIDRVLHHASLGEA